MDADSMIKYVIRDADGKAPGRSIPLQLEIQLMFLINTKQEPAPYLELWIPWV